MNGFHWNNTSSDLSLASSEQLLDAVDSVYHMLNTDSYLPEYRSEYEAFTARMIAEFNRRIKQIK